MHKNTLQRQTDFLGMEIIQDSKFGMFDTHPNLLQMFLSEPQLNW